MKDFAYGSPRRLVKSCRRFIDTRRHMTQVLWFLMRRFMFPLPIFKDELSLRIPSLHRSQKFQNRFWFMITCDSELVKTIARIWWRGANLLVRENRLGRWERKAVESLTLASGQVHVTCWNSCFPRSLESSRCRNPSLSSPLSLGRPEEVWRWYFGPRRVR